MLNRAQHAARPLLGAVGLLLLTCSTLVAQQASTGPVTYAMSTTVDSGHGVAPVVVTMRLRSLSGVMRMDVSNAAIRQTPGTDGAYMLVTNNSDTMTTVVPGQRMVLVGLSAAATMSLMPFVKVNMTGNPTYAVEDLGDGPSILGFRTRHFRVTLAYTLDVTVGDDHCTKVVRTTTDSWHALDTSMPDALSAMVAGYAAAGSTMMGDSMEKLRGLERSKAPKGVLLRAESVDVNGVRSRVEATEFNTNPIDPAMFTAPADYRTLDSRAMMLRSLSDASMQATMSASLRTALCKEP